MSYGWGATFNNVNDLYVFTLASLMGAGVQKSTPRGMPITEHVAASVTLDDPSRCAISLPERKLNYHFMVAEWWWICSGDDRVESIAPYCSEIEKFSDDGKTFFGAYGPRWRPQVERVVQLLREDPDSRQAVVSTWRNNDQWLKYVESATEDGRDKWLPVTKDVPCTLTMQYLVRNGELQTVVTMRSWDAWLGLPYDIFNFSMLAACVAAELGARLGPLTVQAGSLHLYERNADVARVLVDLYTRGDTGWTPSPPAIPLPTGLPSSPTMRAWESTARAGHIGTAREPWSTYLEVLADRKRRDATNVDDPFRTLIYGEGV